MSLEPFQERILPSMKLVPGSSLVGWLEAPAGGLPKDAQVLLAPADETGGTSGVRELVRTATVTERGLFQFRDLPAGFYRVRVELPDWAVLEVGPVEILPGVETRLPDPLVLREPGRLVVCVDPPVPPGVRRPVDTWTVTLLPRERRLFYLRETIDLLGCVRFDDLRPETYDLQLGDERGSRWQSQELRVFSGEQRVDLQVDHFPIHGTLRRDSEPIRALLAFRRKGGGEGESREIREVEWFVDPEGGFEGALPEPGTWYVFATFRSGGAIVELSPVDIADRRGRPQELSLEVPDTRLEGRVVDAENRPVDRAFVGLHRKGSADPERPAGRSAEIRTGRDGRFEVEGLLPGDYVLTAQQGNAAAELEIQVSERVPIPTPTLVLEAMRELRGFAQGELGPVPRARLQFYPEPSAIGFRAIPVVDTDEQGHFRIEVPESATSLRVLVVAAGYGARVVRVPLTEGPAAIQPTLNRLAGTLRVSADAETPLPTGFLLVVDGVPLWLGSFSNWAGSMGAALTPGTWELPSMAPGSYRLCDRRLETCTEGFLGAGETLELEARSPERRAAAGD